MTSIISLLSGSFLKLVVWSFLAAMPVGWYLMHQWLQNFTYHVEIQWWMFALCRLARTGSRLPSVCAISVRTAMMNPAEELKGE